MAWIKQSTQHLYFYSDAHRERVASLTRLTNKHGSDNVKVRVRKRTDHGEVTGFDVVTWTRAESTEQPVPVKRKLARNQVDVEANTRKVARSMSHTSLGHGAALALALMAFAGSKEG